MIPKIFHQTAPTNKKDWHPLWFKCTQSWKDQCSEFEHRMWNDGEIDDLIKQHYPKYWEMYNEFPVHIMKIDFVRFCFLHKYGGIYADMDVYCYKNFYNELEKEIYLLENPLGNDIIENSMMISEAGHPFWIECMELCMDRFKEVKRRNESNLEIIKHASSNELARLARPYFIFYITGTNLISTAARITNQNIYTLPGILYNNDILSYHPDYRTKHIHTGLWGKENIDLGESLDVFKTISVEDFDFYADYTHGNYLKENVFDIDKNDSYGQLTIDTDYEYK